MEADDWITLCAVIVALAIGVASILHTRSILKKEQKKKLLNEIIEWVFEFKQKAVPTDFSHVMLAGTRKYEFISIALSYVMLKAELIKLRVKENDIKVLDELDNVWHSAFFCSQLAQRILGNRPSEQQRINWSKESKAACDITIRIDELEKQKRLTDEEIYNGQKKLLEDISACLKTLVKIEAAL